MQQRDHSVTETREVSTQPYWAHHWGEAEGRKERGAAGQTPRDRSAAGVEEAQGPSQRLGVGGRQGCQRARSETWTLESKLQMEASCLPWEGEP